MRALYVNAEAVLPPAVLEEVSNAVGEQGAYLWIPSRRSLSLEQRNLRIVDLRAEGWNAQKIAAEMHLSVRTVWRVLARKRASAAPSATHAQADVAAPSNREAHHAQ